MRNIYEYVVHGPLPQSCALRNNVDSIDIFYFQKSKENNARDYRRLQKNVPIFESVFDISPNDKSGFKEMPRIYNKRDASPRREYYYWYTYLNCTRYRRQGRSWTFHLRKGRG